MGVNMKFYVITIAAIFLALGIGIFIGFNIDSQQFYMEQQNSLIDEMTKKFDEMKQQNIDLNKKNAEVQSDLELYQQYSEGVFPFFAKDRLNGINVAVIETTDDYIYSSLKNTLKSAGADVVNITAVHSKLEESVNDDALKNKITNNVSSEDMDKNNIPQLTSDVIAQHIINHKYGDLMKYLSDNEYIEMKGDYSLPVDYVIIAGGSVENDNFINAVDIPIIKAIKKEQIPIIGVERSDVKHSYMEDYKKEKISTVDNVDNVIGETSLIIVMQGVEGNYGVKKSSSSLMPAMNRGV